MSKASSAVGTEAACSFRVFRVFRGSSWQRPDHGLCVSVHALRLEHHPTAELSRQDQMGGGIKGEVSRFHTAPITSGRNAEAVEEQVQLGGIVVVEIWVGDQGAVE